MSIESRYVWIDWVKAIAIFLVVLGHVWRGLNEAGLIDQKIFHILDNSIYYFHMPLFFLVSGFLYHKTYKKEWKNIIKRQWLSIIWPYVFWSIILVLVKTIFSSSVNNETDIYSIFNIAYKPVAIFWFLYVLFVSQILVKIFFKNIFSSNLLLIFGFLIFLISDFFDIRNLGIIYTISKSMIYFILGFFIADKNILINIYINKTSAVLAFSSFFFIQFLLFNFDISYENGFCFIATLLLSICVIIICMWFSQNSFAKSPTIKYISLSTLAIYVSHVIFTAGTRIILIKLNADIFTHIFLGTFMGMVCPLILFEFSKKFKISTFIGFGPIRYLK